MHSGNNILLEKLDGFIRKYYKNQLIRGGLWFVAISVTTFLLASGLEYFGHFNEVVRGILFALVTLVTLTTLIKYIAIPLMQMYRIRTGLNYDQAAQMVGKHFPQIGDKLLNTLQLQAVGHVENSLMHAAIEQKTKELNPIPFHQAIDLSLNKRYIKYAAIPLVLFVVIAAANDGFTNSSKRIIQYNTHFERQAPFDFILKNKNLTIAQNEDFEILLELDGEQIPEDAYIRVNSHIFKMKSNRPGQYSYIVKRVGQDVDFNFEASGFSSKEFKIKSLLKPTLLTNRMKIDYPSYTGLEDRWVSNASDIHVPNGTKLSWELTTKHVDSARFYRDSSVASMVKKGNLFLYAATALKPFEGIIRTENEQMEKGDSMIFSVNVIEDLYPEISLIENQDSTSSGLYLLGEIKDDYGFKKLEFHYTFVDSKTADKKGSHHTVQIGINPKARSQGYYHYWDLKALGIQPEDKLEYYFEVWDNDQVSGSKRTKTSTGIFEAPSLDAINARVEEQTEQTKDDINDTKSELKDLQKDFENLEKKLTEKKELSWEDKKKIEELLNKHQSLEKQLENIVDQHEQTNQQEQEFKDVDQDILDKQEQIEKLFDEVMNDEMRELMEKIEELMQQNQKDQLMEKLDELKVNDQEVQKQLDRMLEQLKQLQLEKKVNETLKKLQEQAKEQEALSKESEEGKSDAKDLKEKQEKLSKKFDELKKDLKDIDKKNQDLESPMDLDTKKLESNENNVDQNQSNSEQQLDKGQKGKASESQKKAAEEMKKMEQELTKQMDLAMKQQHMEDINTLRAILNNLIQLSKDQEDLMDEFRNIRGYNPKYVELGQTQKKIKDDAQIIEDSLFALSKRVAPIEQFINKEIGLINHHIEKSIKELGERRTHLVINHQQYVMTSMNNLALMLEQSLDQMQQQMKKQGSGSCSKPGDNPKPGGAKSMREMQEQLKQQYEQMSEQMKQGSKPSSKQFAKAAEQQAAIRRKLQELQKQLEKEGQGNKLGDLNKTQQMMDDLERDLYNKRMTQDMLNRQQEILTRLLEHEKAERNQEKDNKRKSNEGRDMERELPPSIEKYLQEKRKEQELLRTTSPDLTPYYKEKTQEYFERIGK